MYFPATVQFCLFSSENLPRHAQSGQNGETQKHHAHSKLLEPLVRKPLQLASPLTLSALRRILLSSLTWILKITAIYVSTSD